MLLRPFEAVSIARVCFGVDYEFHPRQIAGLVVPNDLSRHAQQFSRIGNREADCSISPGNFRQGARRGSKFADIYQEVRCGLCRSRPWVALLLDCSREFCKAVVGYTDALCVGG